MISAGNDNFVHPDTLYHLIRLNIYFSYFLLLFPFLCLSIYEKKTRILRTEKINKAFCGYIFIYMAKPSSRQTLKKTKGTRKVKRQLFNILYTYIILYTFSYT